MAHITFTYDKMSRGAFWQEVRRALGHGLNVMVRVDRVKRNNVARSLQRIVRREDLPAVVKRLDGAVVVLFL